MSTARLSNYALERSVTGLCERASRGPLNADVSLQIQP